MSTGDIMRFELDSEVNALYIYFRPVGPGEVARTLTLAEGVNLDLDKDGNTLGLEFVEASDFTAFLAAHGGSLSIPDRVEDPEHFSLSPA